MPASSSSPIPVALAQFTHAAALHYLFTVKANQPRLLDRCARLPWHNVPLGDRTRDRGHGRVEIRTLKAVSVRHFGFPHAAQVIQVTRKRRDLHTTKWQTVTVYAITSLPFEQARPARLADLRRRRTTPSRPRPTPTPGHPRDQPRMNPTSRQNAGALP